MGERPHSQYIERPSSRFATDRPHSRFSTYVPSERHQAATGPPPVPPAHSVSLKRQNNDESKDHESGSGPSRMSNRTPSPLRNAIEDVWSSLDSMSVRTPSPVKRDSNVRSALQSSPVKNGMLKSPIRGLNTPPRKSAKSMLLDDDYNNSDNLDINSQNALNERLNSEKEVEIDSQDNEKDEEIDIPFDPSGYGSPMRKNGSVSRQDTYRTMSSMNSNSLNASMSSGCTSPLNSSLSASGGSGTRRRGEVLYKMEAFPGTISEANLPSFETPVTLPGREEVRNTEIKGKKSGFFKKFFSSSTPVAASSRNSMYSVYGGNSSNGVSGGNESLSGSIRLNRQKSQKSFMSGSSRPGSSLSIRETLKKVKSKTRPKSAMDLYPMKSHQSLRSMATSIGLGDSGGNQVDQMRWVEIHQVLNRSNTLSKHEKQRRKSRPQNGMIGTQEPLEQLAKLKGNETSDGYTWADPPARDYTHVDSRMQSLNSWPFITPAEIVRAYIVKWFRDPRDQLRAAFLFCATKLNWEPLIPDDEGVGSLSRVIQTRRANPLELAAVFRSMCETVGVPCTVIAGYLKSPGQVWVPSRPNHYWNAVLVDGLWRMVDASLASPTFPGHDIVAKNSGDKNAPEDFYFLTRPSELLFTHVPYDSADQHVVPPVAHEVLNALPLAGPQAFEHELELVDFSTSLTRLHGTDVAEITIAVPSHLELHAALDLEQSEGCVLAQPFHRGDTRFYRIKAVLPPAQIHAGLNLYVGATGTLKSVSHNTLALAYSIPILHTGGTNPLFHFLTRHPTPGATSTDVYVKTPQTGELKVGYSYKFEVDVFPTRPGTKVKLGIQSPRGKVMKMKGELKMNEVGTWRGLILGDGGTAWCVFAEWSCI